MFLRYISVTYGVCTSVYTSNVVQARLHFHKSIICITAINLKF